MTFEEFAEEERLTSKPTGALVDRKEISKFVPEN
jgi:hypothetical protein